MIEFEKDEILDELRKLRANQYYLYFSSRIDLDVLEIKILKHILIRNNKDILIGIEF